MTRKTFAALTIGLGLGAVGAVLAGPVAFWPGAALAALGVAVAATGSRTPDLVAAATPAPAAAPAGSGLGGRVEQVLRLAEEQAEDHRSEARREAERIVAEARAEAARIRDAAR